MIYNRDMNGIFLINKQSGRTSHDEVAIIKSGLRSVGVRTKVGHSGTLDPKVTGLLVVGIGKGTKMLQYMLLSEKRYTGVIEFHKKTTKEDLQKAIDAFTGVITQLPPQKSSVKRVERAREVYKLTVLEFDPQGRYAVLDCAVERGTYIRKLFHDMGEHMGIGAHMGELHRTHVGPFEISESTLTSDELKRLLKKTKSIFPWIQIKSAKKLQQHLLPLERAIPNLGKVQLHPGVEKYVASGSDIFVPGIESVAGTSKVGESVGVYKQGGELVAIGTLLMSSQEINSAQKGVAVKTTRVLI